MQTSGLPEIKTIPDIEVRTGQFFLKYSESIEYARRAGANLQERNQKVLGAKADLLIAEKTNDGRDYKIERYFRTFVNREKYLFEHTVCIIITLRNAENVLPGEHLSLNSITVEPGKRWFVYPFIPLEFRNFRMDRELCPYEVWEFQITDFSWQRVDN